MVISVTVPFMSCLDAARAAGLVSFLPSRLFPLHLILSSLFPERMTTVERQSDNGLSFSQHTEIQTQALHDVGPAPFPPPLPASLLLAHSTPATPASGPPVPHTHPSRAFTFPIAFTCNISVDFLTSVRFLLNISFSEWPPYLW